MLTKEEKTERDRLVKERPCKECIHYRSNSFLSCGFKCDNFHGGFKRDKSKKKT